MAGFGKQMEFWTNPPTPIQVTLAVVALVAAKAPSKSSVVDNISDLKDFKKLIRTRINVLVLFVKDKGSASATIKVFQEAANQVKGQGTMVLMDCSNRLVNHSNANSMLILCSSPSLSLILSLYLPIDIQYNLPPIQ